MWDFLKKLLSEDDGEVTVVVLDENDPDVSSTFRVKSREFILIGIAVIILSVVLTIGVFFATPLSSIYQQQIDDRFRDEVIAINERVRALQDSLAAREVQLNDLKNFVRNVPDTTFQIDPMFDAGMPAGMHAGFREPFSVHAFDMLTRNDVMRGETRERSPDFPSRFPVEGALTQGFSSRVGHYGVDIAARENSEFRSVADGTVINAGWTINYGNVMYVQHGDGMMSIYKHAARLYKEPGDIVLKGDILGIVGDRGLLSTGSHLHLEIWKDGAPKNPLMYLN